MAATHLLLLSFSQTITAGRERAFLCAPPSGICTVFPLLPHASHFLAQYLLAFRIEEYEVSIYFSPSQFMKLCVGKQESETMVKKFVTVPSAATTSATASRKQKLKLREKLTREV